MTTAANTNPLPVMLVVDDEEGPRQSIRIVFHRDFHVLLASNGDEALALARDNHIDVAILDIRMSGGSGIDVLQSLKTITPTTEVIMLTAYETLETARQALRLGACDYLSKPFDLATIRSAAARALQLHNISKSLSTASARLHELNSRLDDVTIREEMARTTSEIYAGVMHDINNPITVISGHVELLSQKLRKLQVLRGHDLDEVRGDIAIISKQVGTCIAIASRYLRFTRHKKTPDKPLPLARILAELETLLRNNSHARPHTLRIIPPAAGLEAAADNTDLLQMLVNLATNAFQSSEKPQTVTISAAPVEHFPSPQNTSPGRELLLPPPADRPLSPFVAISIKDQGDGIAPDTLTHIFEPYFTTKSQHGTGLGLSIVNRLVQTHCGGIHVATTPGHGTTITVYLPLKTA